MKRLTEKHLPLNPRGDVVYYLVPETEQVERFYEERTDRNAGIILRSSQSTLRKSVVGIAGCGGMGGEIADKLLRLGIGELRIADPDVFDISNIGRQFAATKTTIGKSKAFETARKLRSITDDTTIVVYPMGITSEAATDFVTGCDIIIDEIEFWEMEAALVLHQAARKAGVPILGGNTAGFGTHVFFFTPSSMTIEEVLEVTLDEAFHLDQARKTHTMDTDEIQMLTHRILRTVAPELQAFHPKEFDYILRRLVTEGKAPILSTNPGFAAGFLGDRVVLYLLADTILDKGTEIPPMPGYAYMDARYIQGKVVTEKWW